MIKGRVVLVSINEVIGGVTKLDLETYIDEKASVCLDSFLGDMPWEGLDVVIMTNEEYESMDSASDTLRQSLLEEREETRKLKEENEAIQKDIKDLEEKLTQDVAEVDIHPDGTLVFRKKRISELEKEVERLKEENKALKEDKFAIKITGGLLYKED